MCGNGPSRCHYRIESLPRRNAQLAGRRLCRSVYPLDRVGFAQFRRFPSIRFPDSCCMKAIVTGMIATYPVGGVAWDYGQYALGLERLGFEVYYLEDTGGPTYDPRAKCYGEDCSFAVEFLERALGDLSPQLANRWHFRAQDDRVFGMDAKAIEQIIREAAVFVNVSGSALLRNSYMSCQRKVLIDTDPGWNHF